MFKLNLLKREKMMVYFIIRNKVTTLEGMMLKLKFQYFDHLMRRVDWLEKTLMLGGIWGQEEKGTTEDEMARWHH